MIKRRQFTSACTIGAIVLMLSLHAMPANAAKGLIRIHEADWTGNVAMVRMVQFILEEEMDYKTKKIFLPAGPGVFLAIIAGEIDVGFEFWPSYSPDRVKYISKWGGDGSIAYFGETGFIGNSGWYVPRYVIEGDAERGIEAVAPDLKSWEDLNRYKHLFATPETAPSGRLVACPIAAWQADDIGRVKGLDLDYKTVELGSETAQWAELEAAYKRGEPILIYSWEPHWTHAMYDMVEIDLPPYDENKWPVTDWPEDIPYNFGSPTLQERHPDAYAFLSSMKFTAQQQAEMILDIDIHGMDTDSAVRKWMAAHEDLWRSWIPDM